MDFLTFVASIVSSLAWPAGLVLLVLILREPIGSLIPLLQQLKYRDLELKFGEQIEELRGEIDQEPIDETEAAKDLTHILRLATGGSP